jgi:hypothetical protein
LPKIISKFNQMPEAERYREFIRDIFGGEPCEYSLEMKQSVDTFFKHVPSRESKVLQMIYNLAPNPEGKYCESVRDVMPFVYNKVTKKQGISRNRLYVVWNIGLIMARHKKRSHILKPYITGNRRGGGRGSSRAYNA